MNLFAEMELINTNIKINTSVDSYNSTLGIVINDCDGGTHNPLYDCRAATMAYLHSSSENNLK